MKMIAEVIIQEDQAASYRTSVIRSAYLPHVIHFNEKPTGKKGTRG
ncbi:hypothetical protein [Mahella sp.]|nr:hypothetical protein [Mahella sp.]MBZ4666846.1 hypothetical protein [Mahella sp.]